MEEIKTVEIHDKVFGGDLYRPYPKNGVLLLWHLG